RDQGLPSACVAKTCALIDVRLHGVDAVHIPANDLAPSADPLHLALIHPDGLVAEGFDEFEPVRHKDHGGTFAPQRMDVIEALPLELLVPHGDDLVDDEDI